MRKFLLIAFSLFALSHFTVQSQNELGNPRAERPLGVSAGLAYMPFEYFLSPILAVDYFVTPQIDLQFKSGVSAGYFTYAVGGNFHFNSVTSTNRFSPFAGFNIGTGVIRDFIQFPIGLQYTGRNGFQGSLSFNTYSSFVNNPKESSMHTKYLYTIDLMFGWRF